MNTVHCLLLCAGVPVTSQALIGRPPRSNKIRTSPLPTRVCSLLFHPSVPSFCSVLFCSILLFYLPSFCSVLFCSIVLFSLVLSSLGSALCSILSSIRSIGLLFSRPYSLTLTVRAVILFTALLSTRLLRDATVFIFVDRPPCLLQESSSRPRVLLRLSSSWRPTYPRARRRLPIFESIRAACRPRRHISSPTPVRPDYSHRVPRGCCDSSSIPAPIPVCVDR